MRAFSLLALLSFSSTAVAGDKYAPFTSSVEEVKVSGVVEIPLLSGPLGTSFPLIQATLGEDETVLLGLIFGGVQASFVSEGLAESAGLDVKSGNKRLINLHGEDGKYKPGGEVKSVVLPSLSLGELELVDFKALLPSSYWSELEMVVDGFEIVACTDCIASP